MQHTSRCVCYLRDIACPVWKTCIVPQAVTISGCRLAGRGCDHVSGTRKQIEMMVNDKPDVLIIPENHHKDADPLIVNNTVLGNYIREQQIPVRSFTSGLLERTGPSSGYALKALYCTIYPERESL